MAEYSPNRIKFISLFFLEDLADIERDRSEGKLLEVPKEALTNTPFIDLVRVDRDQTIDVQVLS